MKNVALAIWYAFGAWAVTLAIILGAAWWLR
jgi:hypothetical protein